MANWITLSRLPLLVGYVLMLFYGTPALKVAAVPLVVILMLMDYVDGIVARATGGDSLLGSVLDIAIDRIFELVIWVSFVALRIIPVAIPIIVIMRTALTDNLRSIGVQAGEKPFDQHRTRIGRILVRSRWMRSLYGIIKGAAFSGLTLGLALASYPPETAAFRASATVLAIFVVVSWFSVLLCVVRGLPVIIGTIRRSSQAQGSSD